MSEVPPERWNVDEITASVESATRAIRWGGFVHGIEEFDASYFRISPREALAMDPQQRLVLEVVTEALERGGHRPSDHSGPRSGVFLGVGSAEYLGRMGGADAETRTYLATGNALSVVSNRVSYVYNFGGPSVSVTRRARRRSLPCILRVKAFVSANRTSRSQAV